MILSLRSDAARIPLADGSVHAVCTSSPYYGLRRYDGVPETVWGGDSAHAHEWRARRDYKDSPTRGGGEGIGYDNCDVTRAQRWTESATCACGAWRGCLGNEPTVDLYVAHMVEVFREVRRVLRDDGTCWIVLGDSFGRARAASDANGQLLGVPWLVAFALQKDGWLLRSDICWSKISAMPESVRGWSWQRCRVKVREGGALDGGKSHRRDPARGDIAASLHVNVPTEWADCPGCPRCAANDGFVLRRGSWRPTRAHEIIFMLAKQPGYFCDAEAVAEPAVSTHGSGNGYKREPRESFADADGPRGSSEPWEPLPGATRNPRDVWTLGPEPLAASHFAAFPSEIPRRCILASTSARGVCATCGAPWARVVDVRRGGPTDRASRRPTPDGVDGNHNSMGTVVGSDTRGLPSVESRTLGWRATCEHAGEPVPATVLDPFAGSGTTGRVAIELGRRAVLCDASQTYLRDIADKRTRNVQVELLR